MYLALKAGNTSLLKCAQCGQLAEAYSITVTLAKGLPRVMSSGRADFSTAPRAGPASANPKTAAATNWRRDEIMTSNPVEFAAAIAAGRVLASENAVARRLSTLVAVEPGVRPRIRIAAVDRGRPSQKPVYCRQNRLHLGT